MIALVGLESGRYDFLPTDVRDRARTRYDQDNRGTISAAPVTDLDLLPYTDFADLAKMLYSLSAQLESAGQIPIDELAKRLDSMAAARNRVCHSRPLEEEDLPSFLDLAKLALGTYASWEWANLRDIQRKLGDDPTFVLRLQIPEFWRLDEQRVPHNLPLPDYDDTSFLGRTTERKDIKKYLLGRHPVVTIVGEGGVGKTALALQCVYDLLDLGEACPFEAVVWVSLKTKILTAAGIANIRDAFVDVLGVVQEVALQLGGLPVETIDGAMAEVLDYLAELKVLLVIDNFETLSTNPFRLLLGDVPGGSKVLITSRIGLGEFEVRYPLDTLDMKTAVVLLRKYARALNLSLLAEASQERAEKYANFLFRSPLLIKWFVQSVSAGGDPEQLSARRSQQFASALKFCFEDLFERLSPGEREILHLLAAARRQLTFTELMFLIQEMSKTDLTTVESALSTLHRSSMIKRTAPEIRSPDVSTRLNLTDIGFDYIAKFAPPNSQMMEKVQAALKKLRESTEQSVVQTETYKYEIFAVRAKTKDERICAVYLNRALRQVKDGNLPEARNLVARAFTMLPSYVEAYRVASLIESAAGDLFKASEELENALQHDSKAAIVRYHYGQFLLQKMDDPIQALVQIDAALALDPGDETLETLRALALVRTGRYPEAADIYESQLAAILSRPRKWRITTRDQAAECFRRWAEKDRRMKDNKEAKIHLERSLEICEKAIAHEDFDDRMGRTYASAIEDLLYFG